MKIIVGKTAGFCYGVKRAVKGVNNELLQMDTPIYCLGEIVHNNKVIENLKNKGLIFVENIKHSKGKTIIRAHGVAKEIYDIAQEEKIELKDYTCPNVLKIHQIAEEYKNKGYYIFLCGSKDHPENIGTSSYCGKNVYIIEDEKDIFEAIKQLKESKINKLLVISQTTYGLESFYKIEQIVKDKLQKNIRLVIKNTICKATELRQKETEEISKKVDYMIIIGGVNSSNTKKLYDVAKNNCKNSICIENANELPIEEVKKQNKIGIMAGASTPQESIEEIINKIKDKLQV